MTSTGSAEIGFMTSIVSVCSFAEIKKYDELLSFRVPPPNPTNNILAFSVSLN